MACSHHAQPLLELTHWAGALSQGFNLCFYGYGEKSSLLAPLIEVLRKVYTIVRVDYCKLDQVTLSSTFLLLPPTSVYVWEVNLDRRGLDWCHSLRAKKIVLLDGLVLPWTKSDWLFFDLTSFLPHLSPRLSQINKQRKGRQGLLKDTALSVLPSLTKNARAVFGLLINHQLVQQEKQGEEEGWKWCDFYQTCRENFLVSSEAGLKALLVEFRDHSLVRMDRRTLDGEETFIIPLSTDSLLELLPLC